MDSSLVDIVAEGNLRSLKAKLSTVSNLAELINIPVDSGGATLLHLAANSSPELLYYLLDNDANPNCLTEDGLTPLHIAAMWGRKENVRGLLCYGADSTLFDNEGLMAIDYARDEDHKDCVFLLESGDPGYEPDVRCEQPGDLSCAESFVAIFETFTADSNSAILHYPDVVEDTLLDEHYQTALSSPDLHINAKVSSVSIESPSTPSLKSPPSSNVHTSPEDEKTSRQLNSSLECSFTGEIQTPIPKHVQKLSNSELSEHLIALGEQPGPINDFTRRAYLVYLTKLQSGITVRPTTSTDNKGFRYELALVLNGMSPVPNVKQLEDEVVSSFTTHHTPTQAGTAPARTPVRDNFNYILLDPRKLQGNSPTTQLATDLECFRLFIEAVFYIGKGKNSRPIQHLKDARSILSKGGKVNSKLKQIASIWESGRGIISLPIYHNTHDGEAFTRECCMIDTIGLENLTNQVKGHMHGAVRQWTPSKRRQYGVFLLHKAFQVFRLTGPPEIHQQDL